MPSSKHLLIRACAGESTPRTPVWAMRQAGRWDPEFQAIRQGRAFYEFSENSELAAQASLCPRRFGVDAIILFYDITTLSVAMGQRFELVAGRGPVPERSIRQMDDVRRLASVPDIADYRHVLETLRLVQNELSGELPVLVFAGAPFTLASYMIGTGKDLAATRRFISERPEVWSALCDKTARATVAFLRSLLDAGAGAYQLFDSWAGALEKAEYDALAHHWHRQIFSTVGGISILFVKDNPYLERMTESGAQVISLSTAHDLAACRARFPNLVFQGNVDHQLLVSGTSEEVRLATEACLRAGGGRRHILNLDHGMDKDAKPENFAAFVAAAHSP